MTYRLSASIQALSRAIDTLSGTSTPRGGMSSSFRGVYTELSSEGPGGIRIALVGSATPMTWWSSNLMGTS